MHNVESSIKIKSRRPQAYAHTKANGENEAGGMETGKIQNPKIKINTNNLTNEMKVFKWLKVIAISKSV